MEVENFATETQQPPAQEGVHVICVRHYASFHNNQWKRTYGKYPPAPGKDRDIFFNDELFYCDN